MDIAYIWFILAIVGAFLHVISSKKPKLLNKKPRTKNRIIEIFLMYLLVLSVGIGSIWSFIGHTFLANQVAAYIGWSIGSPFQFEVAIANLSYGILGILCLKFRGNFWIATVIAFSTFYLGAAYGHIADIVLRGNFAPGNAGDPLYLDIIVPIILIILLIAHEMTTEKQIDIKTVPSNT